MRTLAIFLVSLIVVPAVVLASAELPLKNVVLFNSGVGYFERSDEVAGAVSADLSFKTEQLNDVLKSLVLIDEGGGDVTFVTYDAKDPAERTLKSFSVDLSDSPSFGTILQRMRGVAVRVTTSGSDLEG
ncbi:MAG: hypothetical protein KJ626_05040, partial [Verrucomicrobia bacterium]|nr:hypothetical protein [Verrucomicrobiota bacterium]